MSFTSRGLLLHKALCFTELLTKKALSASQSSTLHHLTPRQASFPSPPHTSGGLGDSSSLLGHDQEEDGDREDGGDEASQAGTDLSHDHSSRSGMLPQRLCVPVPWLGAQAALRSQRGPRQPSILKRLSGLSNWLLTGSG